MLGGVGHRSRADGGLFCSQLIEEAVDDIGEAEGKVLVQSLLPLLGEVLFSLHCSPQHTHRCSTDPLLGNPLVASRGAGVLDPAPTTPYSHRDISDRWGWAIWWQLPSWANPGQIVWCGWGKDQWWPALVHFFPFLLNRILALRAMVQLV